MLELCKHLIVTSGSAIPPCDSLSLASPRLTGFPVLDLRLLSRASIFALDVPDIPPWGLTQVRGLFKVCEAWWGVYATLALRIPL